VDVGAAAGELVIGPLQADDWPAVREIYEEGIATGDATFDSEAPSWAAWDASHLGEPRLAARRGGVVVGWAVLAPVSDRPVYAGVCELSIYVGEQARGQGVGYALLRELIAASERAGIWTLQAGIFPENVASLALHRRCGFRDVGIRERMGQHDGVWRDVVLLERRSAAVT
jgi:phosphinothricin acetyltransferase